MTRKLTEGGVDDPMLEAGSAVEHVAEHGHEHEQQREEREEPVVGDRCREVPGPVVAVLPLDRERERNRGVSPSQAVEPERGRCLALASEVQLSAADHHHWRFLARRRPNVGRSGDRRGPGVRPGLAGRGYFLSCLQPKSLRLTPGLARASVGWCARLPRRSRLAGTPRAHAPQEQERLAMPYRLLGAVTGARRALPAPTAGRQHDCGTRDWHLYDRSSEYLFTASARLARAGLEAGEAVLVAIPAERHALVRNALGLDAELDDMPPRGRRIRRGSSHASRAFSMRAPEPPGSLRRRAELGRPEQCRDRRRPPVRSFDQPGSHRSHRPDRLPLQLPDPRP